MTIPFPLSPLWPLSPRSSRSLPDTLGPASVADRRSRSRSGHSHTGRGRTSPPQLVGLRHVALALLVSLVLLGLIIWQGMGQSAAVVVPTATMTCEENLTRIGQALLAYHDRNGHFPPAVNGRGSGNSRAQLARGNPAPVERRRAHQAFVSKTIGMVRPTPPPRRADRRSTQPPTTNCSTMWKPATWRSRAKSLPLPASSRDQSKTSLTDWSRPSLSSRRGAWGFHGSSPVIWTATGSTG